MKRAICALVLSGLVCLGLIPASPGKTEQTAADISEVLRAHNVQQHADSLAAFNAEAVKSIFYEDTTGDDTRRFFERKVSVSCEGVAFKRHSRDPLGLRTRIDLFDGRAGYRAVVERGAQAGETNLVEESRLQAVRFAVSNFGLVPILRQLSRGAADVFYAGRTAQNELMFQVKTDAGVSKVFADKRRLIRKIESGSKSIEYADYRDVDGVQLPFIQRVYVAGKLVYELIFTGIDLAPAFPAGYFSREALATQVVQ